MGNTSSTSNRASATSTPDTPHPPHRSASRRARPALSSPRPPEQREPSADAPSSSYDRQKPLHRPPHPSLRTKKKSLELPDLALALTSPSPGASQGTVAPSVPGGPYRRPQPSSPIAIPSRNNAQVVPNGVARGHHDSRLKTAPTMASIICAQPMAEVIVKPSSRAVRGNPHIRGAPLQYSSTHSFAGTGRGQPMQSFVLRDQPHGGFIPEDVHSSIPLALRKAEIDTEEEADRQKSKHTTGRESTEEKRPAQVCIVWRGGGKNVVLVRAGDNNWKGRQPMDYDETTKQWTTWISLLPGTHHIRFLVDGVSTVAEDLPTAVDDNGTLANYVAVPISGFTPPSASLHPQQREQIPPPLSGNGNSFFADADAGASGNDKAEWTDQVPWQLECAAEEEELWLSQSHTHGGGQQPPPQHPQAPSLPRHLEKLIMNQKPPNSRAQVASKVGAGSNSRPMSGILPVATASGTNLGASSSGQQSGSNGGGGTGSTNFMNREMYTKLESSSSGSALADDGSVLPVPSHVVLHHLGTSAIRNGVLAVADTVRYKKKYITTIYYKPT